MSNHKIALTSGQMANFVGEGTKALISIADRLGPDLADNWARNGEAMRRAFLRALMPLEVPSQEMASPPAQPAILRSISQGKKVTIPACTGTRTIAQSGAVFTGSLDSAFNKFNIAGRNTPPTTVEIYVVSNTFREIIGALSTGLSTDPYRLVFTQNQVVAFVEAYPNWLSSCGGTTLFLLREGNQFFIVRVYSLGEGKLEVELKGFLDSRVYFASYDDRLVVPLLH